MPTEDIKSNELQQAAVGKAQHTNKVGGRIRHVQGEVVVTETAGSNGSTYKAVKLPYNARLINGTIYGDGAVDCPNVSVGLMSVSDETVVVDNVLGSTLDIDDTGRHDFGDTYNVLSKEVWELAGLAAKPDGGQFYLLLTLKANAVAAGNMLARAAYVVD